jgi:hypothetical protein
MVSVTNNLAVIKASAAALWDFERNDCGPEDVVAGSNKKFWFNLPIAGSVQRPLSSFKSEILPRRLFAVSQTLASAAPEVAAQWHPTKNGDVTPADIRFQTSKKYWWRCDAGPDHVWEASPHKRVGKKVGCPCCSGHKMSVTNIRHLHRVGAPHFY